MKKLLLFTASLLLLGGTTSSAQDWKEALKKAATAAADKATDGKLTQYALTGTWNYTGPGVKFEGGDIASEVGGAALETAVVKQLEKAYAKAGIRPGAGTFTFSKDDDAFTATLGSHTLSGTYEYDAPTHVVTLHFAKGKLNLGSVPATPTSAGRNWCWSSRSPDSSRSSRRSAAKSPIFRRPRRCCRNTRTSTSASPFRNNTGFPAGKAEKNLKKFR